MLLFLLYYHAMRFHFYSPNPPSHYTLISFLRPVNARRGGAVQAVEIGTHSVRLQRELKEKKIVNSRTGSLNRFGSSTY
jgi:hypothetical protein